MLESINSYLKAKGSDQRIEALRQIKEDCKTLPISFVSDMLCLGLEKQEQMALVNVAGSNDELVLEHFLTSNIEVWDQEVASFAIRRWANETQHLLWFRMLPLAESRLSSQRVLYTILDLCWACGGDMILQTLCEKDGIEDLSEAFHGLFMYRSLQWNFYHERIHRIAVSTITQAESVGWPDNKALSLSIAWLARFQEEDLKQVLLSKKLASPWLDMIHFHLSATEHKDIFFSGLDRSIDGNHDPKQTLIGTWPPLWFRHHMKSSTITHFLSQKNRVTPLSHEINRVDWQHFAGCSPTVIKDALRRITDHELFMISLNQVQNLLSKPVDKEIVGQVKDRLVAPDALPEKILARLNGRLRLEVLSSLNQLGPTHKKVLEEERLVLGRQKDLAISSVLDLEKAAYSGQGPGAEPPDELIPRKTFFDLAYRHREVISMEGSYWATLQENWLRPNRDALSELAVLARKQVDLYRLCYIHTLAQFSGEDTAALKLLDFIRATDLVELQAVIHALAGIGTPRAIQEMISALTRPNMSHSLRLEVCHLLQDRDLSKVQLELRSAIKDLSVPGANPQDQIEIKELLEDFLLSSEISQKSTQGMVGETESIDLDRSLTPKIPHYQNLSSEVRRALRTAQFFDQQVQKSGSSAHSIDLSPAIDMQYKALELTFREIFEQECFQVINNGILQRKLDVIGYARPIPNAMDNFEGYMASLPVVKDTPYFSKFKLRKMLRAICQYRPGKRFTLDGIKAFSLFFLCFGRKNCQFGLEQIIDLGFANDAELAEFCKTLHIFQDLRNRAAHEGFHPDAHNDIDGIWKLTGDIVAGVFSVKEKFKFTPPQLGHFGPAKQQPIIERRSSPKQAS